MAQHAMNYSDYEHAVASYKEALTYNEGDGRVGTLVWLFVLENGCAWKMFSFSVSSVL